ncbi:uncharacterized protein LOC100201133 isoform X2 [Hydra vulgaris]|uniref:Uncharacterized protein LOC100201133 isoform X2 n=1 Tax=Hydra vulgaris TaxID=6087 RepID=A0ABM4CKL1_HYDVU
MDRGFARIPPSNHRDDRLYDSYYSDRRLSGNSFRNVARGGSQNKGGRDQAFGGQWGGANRDRGFFGQGGQNSTGRDRGGQGGFLNGQMLETLKQQQSLLSAFMTTQSQHGLMNQRNLGRFGNQSNQNRGQYNNRGSRGSNRPGDKRKSDGGNNSSMSKKSKKPATTVKKEAEANKVELDIPDSEVVIPDSLMDAIEELRQRKDNIERNVADEDVGKLTVFSFTGKGYSCKTCGSILNNKQTFSSHVMGKSHVMKVIEARTAKTYQETRDLLDIDLAPDDWYEKSEKVRSILLMQAKLIMKQNLEKEQQERLNYNSNPANFFTVSMETRKTAVKNENVVTITSLVESRMEIKDFVGDKFFGCEFVKAVSGFHCRLCDSYIKDAAKVVPHINDKQHRNNYQAHIRKNANYEKQQKDQNADLAAILAEQENKNVLLSQTPGVSSSPFLLALEPSCIQVPKLMNPKVEEKEKTVKPNEDEKGEEIKEVPEKETEKEESVVEETTIESASTDDKESAQLKDSVDDSQLASESNTLVVEEVKVVEEIKPKEEVKVEEESPLKSILKVSKQKDPLWVDDY